MPLMSMLILSHCCLESVDIWSGRKQMFSKQQLIISLLYFGVEHVLCSLLHLLECVYWGEISAN